MLIASDVGGSTLNSDVAGCTVAARVCDVLIASAVAARSPDLDTGVEADVAGRSPDPDKGVDVDVSTPPQPITSRVIKETAAVVRSDQVRASRRVLLAT